MKTLASLIIAALLALPAVALAEDQPDAKPMPDFSQFDKGTLVQTCEAMFKRIAELEYRLEKAEKAASASRYSRPSSASAGSPASTSQPRATFGGGRHKYAAAWDQARAAEFKALADEKRELYAQGRDPEVTKNKYKVEQIERKIAEVDAKVLEIRKLGDSYVPELKELKVGECGRAKLASVAHVHDSENMTASVNYNTVWLKGDTSNYANRQSLNDAVIEITGTRQVHGGSMLEGRIYTAHE